MDANAKGERPRIYMSSRTHKVVVVFPNGEVVEGKENLIEREPVLVAVGILGYCRSDR